VQSIPSTRIGLDPVNNRAFNKQFVFSYPVLLKNWFNSSHLHMYKHPVVNPNNEPCPAC
jgi:hypothetical protein